MSARRPADLCANPVCRTPIDADQLDALELVQLQPDPDRAEARVRASWRLCNTRCARQYLALCDLRAYAQTHPERLEAQA